MKRMKGRKKKMSKLCAADECRYGQGNMCCQSCLKANKECIYVCVGSIKGEISKFDENGDAVFNGCDAQIEDE
jgi:hypothetical protein